MLTTLLIAAIVIAIVVYVLKSAPIPAPFDMIAWVVLIIAVLIWALRFLGVNL